MSPSLQILTSPQPTRRQARLCLPVDLANVHTP